jgi:hypothetical protein
MNGSDLPCLLVPKLMRRVLLAVGVVGLTLSAAAQLGASWKMQLGSHDLCCGPRGGMMDDDGSGGLHLPPDSFEMAPARLSSGSTETAAASVPVSATPAPVAPAAAAAASDKPMVFEKTASGYDAVGFDFLSGFEFNPPDYDPSAPDAKPPSGADQIPANVKALDQRKVAVTGFMLPTKMEGSLVVEFLLVKDAMMCCYGAMPRVNEWIVVKMTGKGVKPLMDIPVTFEGKLTVGEMFENGYLTGLYLLDGEALTKVEG